MPGLLLSGPAGAGKSQEAARQRALAAGPAVIVDFQSLYVALTGDVRAADGSYPPRDPRLLPVVEYLRRAALTATREREIAVIATNSDGDAARRAFLLGELGDDAIEQVIDPGEAVVRGRLTNPVTGVLADDCLDAIGRWYG